MTPPDEQAGLPEKAESAAATKRLKYMALARLRASGMSYEKCAEVLNVSQSTISHYPCQDRELWADVMAKALDDHLLDVEPEALLVAQKDLRDPDARIRKGAVQELLRHARETRLKRVNLDLSMGHGMVITFARMTEAETRAEIDGGESEEPE